MEPKFACPHADFFRLTEKREVNPRGLNMARARAEAAQTPLVEIDFPDDIPKPRKVFVPKTLDTEMVAQIEVNLTPIKPKRYRILDLEVRDWRQTKNSSMERQKPGRKLWNVT